MDSYLLDTNVVSALLKGNHPNLTLKSESIRIQQQIIPSVVRAELLFGWHDAAHYPPRIPELEVFLASFPTAAFDDNAAQEYGRLRSCLKKAGQLIGPNDVMIASVALANKLILVIHNAAEFARVPGLVIGDWQVG